MVIFKSASDLLERMPLGKFILAASKNSTGLFIKKILQRIIIIHGDGLCSVFHFLS